MRMRLPLSRTAGKQMAGMDRAGVSALGLTALLAGAGILHFRMGSFFEPMIPKVLPGQPQLWVQLSGVAELGCAALVAVPATRRVGGWSAAALFVVVFPANIQMALDSAGGSGVEQTLAWGRLPLQLPLFLWARAVARAAKSGRFTTR